MTVTTTTERHKEFILLPIFAFVWHIKDKELYVELGLIQYTITIHVNFKTK
jgi:hypothetical protein